MGSLKNGFIVVVSRFGESCHQNNKKCNMKKMSLKNVCCFLWLGSDYVWSRKLQLMIGFITDVFCNYNWFPESPHLSHPSQVLQTSSVTCWMWRGKKFCTLEITYSGTFWSLRSVRGGKRFWWFLNLQTSYKYGQKNKVSSFVRSEFRGQYSHGAV